MHPTFPFSSFPAPMKRFTVAGIFAMIGGAATLLLVVSILYSCRQGGQPHDMGTDARSNDSAPSVVEEAAESSPTARRSPNAARLTIPHS